MRIGALERRDLTAASELLAEACRFDRAEVVAEEKLFGDAPSGLPMAIGAWDGTLVGVASVGGSRVRVLAVRPGARGRGVGSALIAKCEELARAGGATKLRTLDQPGNYLAPGIDERNVETIAWLERRGWAKEGEPRLNVLIDVRGNARVSVDRAGEIAEAARARGYEIRRARRDEAGLIEAVRAEFGGAWPFEVGKALGEPVGARAGLGEPVGARAGLGNPVGVHVALRDGAYCAFAAHDGNNRGLGWFGPTGTWPAHRGQRLGEALLMACLVDVAAHHARCEVAWIGPRPFYDKVAGVADDRRFVLLTRALI